MTCTDKAADIRVGDEFEVPFRVKYATSMGETKGYYCDGPGQQSDYWLSEACLLAGRRVARPLGIGDRVKHGLANQSLRPGTILAVDKNEAWVRWDDAPRASSVLLSDLERAPAPDTKEGT